MMRFLTGLGVVLAVSTLATAPLTVLARGSHAAQTTCKSPRHHSLDPTTQTVFQFGTQGGSIRTYSIAIQRDGEVVPNEGIVTHTTQLADPQNALKGLIALSDALGFWTMAKSKQCPGLHPDVAGQFIRIQAKNGSRTVAVRGGCVSKFAQLYAVLSSAAGAGTS